MYDVAVIGAGPAGSFAAARLADAGARVALLDGSHPREKPCGGGVTGRALRLVAGLVSPTAMSGVHIERATFSQGQARAQVVLPSATPAGETPLMVFPRAEFDAALLHAALGKGAHHLPRRVRDIRPEGNTIQVALDDGSSLFAAWLIGADGANSLARRRLYRPFDRSELSIAAGFFVHGVPRREIAIEFESDPPGYLWAFPRPDHLAIGACAQADAATAGQLRGVARRWMNRERLEGQAVPYSWPIPSLSAAAVDRQHPASGRWLLVGDAAGLVDPITREGIFFALRSAQLAADAIIAASAPAETYLVSLGDEVLPELRRAAELKEGFFRPQFTALLVHALQTSAQVRRIMADLVCGTQPYRTLVRRLVSTLEFGLAWRLFTLRGSRRGRGPAVRAS